MRHSADSFPGHRCKTIGNSGTDREQDKYAYGNEQQARQKTSNNMWQSQDLWRDAEQGGKKRNEEADTKTDVRPALILHLEDGNEVLAGYAHAMVDQELRGFALDDKLAVFQVQLVRSSAHTHVRQLSAEECDNRFTAYPPFELWAGKTSPVRMTIARLAHFARKASKSDFFSARASIIMSTCVG
jgi:hypothetical protein